VGTVSFEGLVIFCADVEKSAAFYEGLLGLRRQSSDGDITLALPTKGNPEGAWLLLHKRHEGIDVTPHELGTFTVDDVDGLVERLRADGHRITSEPTDQPWGVREANVADPDGYTLTLSQPLPTASS